MKRKLGILLAGVWLCAWCHTATGLTWISTQAPVRNWTSVACSGGGAKILAVDDAGGIYFSIDGSQQWSASPAPNQSWNSVACSANGAKGLAVGKSGIARSANFSAGWTAANVPPGTADATWISVAMSGDGSTCVAAAAHEGVFVSAD